MSELLFGDFPWTREPDASIKIKKRSASEGNDRRILGSSCHLESKESKRTIKKFLSILGDTTSSDLREKGFLLNRSLVKGLISDS